MKSLVAILASANCNVEPLPALNHEANQIQRALQEVEDETGIQTVYLPHLTLSGLTDAVQKQNWLVSMFHFAGHAEDGGLKVGGQLVAFGKLGRILAEQMGTQVVFLNGCGTGSMVEELLAAGIPAIISTRSSVGDDSAAFFAVHFYKAMANGKSLKEAFQIASDLVASKSFGKQLNFSIRRVDRALNIGSDRLDERDQWDLFVGVAQDQVLEWTLYGYQQTKRRKRRLIIGLMLVLGILLAIPIFRMAMLETRQVRLVLRDVNEGKPFFNLPKEAGFELVVEAKNEIIQTPLDSWEKYVDFSDWRWKNSSYKVYIVKQDTPYSDPNFTLHPRECQDTILTIAPMFGRMGYHGDSLPLNPGDTLLLQARYSNGLVEFSEEFQLTYPGYMVESLLSYRYIAYRPSGLRLFVEHEDYELERGCFWIPARKGQTMDSDGFECNLRKKNRQKISMP